MAIGNFKFSKRWTDSSPETGFPTFEPDEAKVRADMQYLFDELASYINTNITPRLNFDESSFADLGDAITNILQQLVDMTQGSVADKAITAIKLADGAAVGTPVDVTEAVNLTSEDSKIEVASSAFLYYRALGAVYFTAVLSITGAEKGTTYYLTQDAYAPRTNAMNGFPGLAVQPCHAPSNGVSIVTVPNLGQGRCHELHVLVHNFADTAYTGNMMVSGWYGCDGPGATEEAEEES